jgi:hypothetical protein
MLAKVLGVQRADQMVFTLAGQLCAGEAQVYCVSTPVFNSTHKHWHIT